MQTVLHDRVPLSGIRRDSAGNLVAVGRAARTGVQVYAGYEVGRPDLPSVRVYRPPEEVFNRDSMRTFAGAPVTIEHPPENVTPGNWKDYAVGETASDDIVRDGEVVKVPFLIRDAAGQRAVEDGKHEISMGYGCVIDWTSGVVPDGQADAGQAYDATSRNIRINHLAIVDKARGGSTLRIGDQKPEETTVTTIPYTVDGITLNVNPEAKQLLDKQAGLISGHVATIEARDSAIKELTAERDKLKGEKAALEQKVKDAEEASSPARLSQLADQRAKLVIAARKLDPKVVVDGKTDAEIRRAVVTARMGDAAKDMSDDTIFGAFTALAPAADSVPAKDGLTAVIVEGVSDSATELAEARDSAKQARLARFQNFGQDPAAS